MNRLLILCLALFILCRENKVIETDRFIFTKEFKNKLNRVQFRESIFSKVNSDNFKEITWILCNQDSLDNCFNSNSKIIELNQNKINFGSYLLTQSNEYLHVKLISGISGWIKETISLQKKEKVFLKNLLNQLIARDKDSIVKEYKNSFYKNKKIKSIDGFITVTHFKNMRYAFINYTSILIVEGFNYNLKKFSEGYFIDLELLAISEKSIESSGSIGFNFNSDSIFEFHRDPYFYRVYKENGRLIIDE